MFNSIRSRLLLSYLLVIATVLLAVVVALFVYAAQPGLRYVPTLQQLATVSRVNRQQIVRLMEVGADDSQYELLLQETAVQNDMRVLVADIASQLIIFDSDDSWLGVSVGGIENVRRLLPNLESDAVSGVFTAPDGGRWLVYSRPISVAGFGRLLIFYAAPEPTPRTFFNETFSRPILVAGLLSLIVSVVLAFGIAGWVARPLQRAASAAKAVARGDYEQRVPVTGPDEVQTVARSFNSMAAQVKTSNQAQRDFVSNVSHDLKTPLTAIRGWSQSLLDGTAVSEAEQQRAAGIIYNEAERMQRMVNQLLDLARIESGQLELVQTPVDLHQLLTDVHNNLMLRAQDQKIHLTCDLQSVPPISGDYDRLMQMFTNLLDNALTHTSAEGRVHMVLKRHDEKTVEVTVQDTGSGIAPEDMARIFERFYQVEKSRTRENGRRGSGLGLAIVRELVEAHQGSIRAYSQVGEGSAFVVRLPVSD
ncbi:MAG: HAMP domain-containing histidine kinase [Anaerolineae bacterium]|nr:HAMP domain-containing histidine kinase [Anaerolineae bacterium]